MIITLYSGVLAATLLLTLLPAVGAGGGHTDASLCVSDRVDEVTDACCVLVTSISMVMTTEAASTVTVTFDRSTPAFAATPCAMPALTVSS